MKSKDYENYSIDDHRENTLIFYQILSTILKRNVWRSVWRICIWILGLKGLRNRFPESGKFFFVECIPQEIFARGILNPGLWNRNTTQGIRNPAKSGVQDPLTKIRNPGIDGVESEIKVYLGLPYRRRY